MIPCANPGAQYRSHAVAIQAAVARVLERGRYILGEEVAAFEREFASYLGVPHGIGVATGTDALHLALRAAGVGPGDEVVTVAHTAVATVAAIQMAGATPVLVDIEPKHFTIDPVAAARAITPRTKAIVGVHLYGHPFDVPALSELADRHGLTLIEDCAQAAGAAWNGRRVGSLGTLACFSFYPTKNLGAIGDGGFVATRDDAMARRVRELREYGWRERYVSHVAGFNSRLDEMQAAILRVKLPSLDRDNAARAAVAKLYDEALSVAGFTTPHVRPGATHAYHLYVARVAGRDEVQASLRAKGVETAVHYPVPVHRQPAYADLRLPAAGLPQTERAAREVLSLPMYPELSIDDARSVVRAAAALASVSA